MWRRLPSDEHSRGRRVAPVILALTIARRELRGGVRGLWIVLLCLALGVGVIAAVGTLRAAVDAGLAADGRALLGGDLEIDGGSQPLPEALSDWLRARGATVSDVTQMRSMLVAASGERQLVELKAVDARWPLVGEASTDPAGSIAEALGQHGGMFGLLAERVVLDRLRLHRGDVVRLGTASFRVDGALTHEPDRVGTAALLGARVLISADALASTGLISPGAMVRYAVRVTCLTRGVMRALWWRVSGRRFRIAAGVSGIRTTRRRGSVGSSTRPRCS